jgi:hypothetical protein
MPWLLSESSKKKKKRNPEIPQLGIYPKEMKPLVVCRTMVLRTERSRRTLQYNRLKGISSLSLSCGRTGCR